MLSTVHDVARRIQAGERLLLAGQEECLCSLPAGEWIGGTIPYFMADDGGVVARDRIFATPVPPELGSITIRTYDTASLPRICTDAPDNGVTFIILPAGSAVHLDFAQHGPNYEQMYLKPLLGWISGFHLDDMGKASAAVVDGRTRHIHRDRAIVLQGSLPPGSSATIGIVNPFRQGNGATLMFEQDGFQTETVLVDGIRHRFADYLEQHAIDTRLPLVADYAGTMINVSFQSVDKASGAVRFYAPVFKAVRYRVAAPLPDYLDAFRTHLPKKVAARFSCNCILNFLYSGLEGRKTGSMTGPITFGEIAYQLLNQTLVYLVIDDH